MVTARVLHDGTNGLYPGKVSDPIGLESDTQQPDVSEAHVRTSDWKFLGCRVEEDGPVYINTVGTFGISSTSFYWSRVSGAIGRLTQYWAGHSSATWHVPVADDFHLEAGGQECRFALLSFFILSAVAFFILCAGSLCRGRRHLGGIQ